ncbi:MAG TPA: hypothetical protein DCP28_17530, partial [Cytophagales bacterium]|nr:hypothetical protein [Cytophagales bacterium]
LFIALTFAISNCTPPATNPVAEATGMAEIFTENELEDLQAMLQLFETQQCALLEESATDLADCYHAFAVAVVNGQPGTDYLPISYEAQHITFGDFHSGTLATFWNNQMLMRADDPNKQIMTLVYQPEGKIQTYLDLLGEEYILIKQYADTFRNIHTITPKMEEDVLRNLKVFNLADIRVRVFLAVHFLTLNDNYKRRGNLPVQVTSPEVDS